MGSALDELNRRGVIRAAAVYVAIAWGATEILSFLVDAFWGHVFAAPARTYLAILFVAGFPVVMYLSWTRDLGLRARRVVGASALGALLVAGLIWLLPAPQPQPEATIAGTPLSAVNPKSIAVLPFVDLSGDGDNQYFSDGVSEEILNRLARIPGLKVTSRTSSFHFAGRDLPLAGIATQLGVRHVLEGSVRRSGSRVRITAQLIDASDDSQVWSEIYDREILDLFVVQQEIARAIADRLRVTFEGARDSARPTDSEEAYDLYLRGWHFLRQSWTQANMIKARDHFLAALERDPGYAQARALLAATWVGLGNFRYVAGEEAMQQAQQNATAALELDDRLPDAHWARGWVAISYRFDRLAAMNSFRRAIELAPSNYMGHQGMAWALMMGGRYEEALAEAQRAHELDPLNVWTRSTLAELAYKMRDYEAALAQTQVLQEVQPGDANNTAFVGTLYRLTGATAEARRAADEALSLAAGDPNLELDAAQVYAALDDRDAALRILQRAEALGASQYVSPGSIAAVYASLGEGEQALDWLERAVAEYDSYVFNLDYPLFDPIRAEPRFMALCERLNMACGVAGRAGGASRP
jgi:TolB-like protein/Flp pilus assembly protein TadD